MAGRGFAGGIWGLLDLIEEHRAALRYDWRTRFGKSLDTIPSEFDWAEALDLVRVLRSDPSSQIAAAIEGWSQPHSHTDLILMRQYEASQVLAGAKKPQVYPTAPWAKPDKSQRWGNTGGRTRAEIVAILNARGHNLPD